MKLSGAILIGTLLLYFRALPQAAASDDSETGMEGNAGSGCRFPHIQLSGGSHRCEGLMRVNLVGNWEYGCRENISNETVQVVCRQLGCGPPVAVFQGIQDYTINNTQFFPYDCNGNESTLHDCQVTDGECGPPDMIEMKCEETISNDTYSERRVTNIDCGHPGNISNGTVTLTRGTKEGDTAYYTCNDGTELNGTCSSRVCRPDGRWSGVEPSCDEIMKCPKLKDIEHGWVTVDFVQSMYFGRYNCIPGYKLDGAWFRSCTDGQWEGTAPACVEVMIDCGQPGNITNGDVDVSEGTREGAFVRYTCDSEYKLNGREYRRCQNNGLWSGTEPICQMLKDCGHPGNITNGDVDISNGTQVGDVVMYTCDSGYKLSGREYRICQNVGNWSGTEPTCQIDCGHPGFIPGGSVSVWGGTTLGSYARYSCYYRYVLKGTSPRICGEDGMWSGTKPTCEVIDCGHPGNIANGRVTTVFGGTGLGSTARYTCDERYVLNGTSLRRCGSNSMWSETEPTCVVPRDCTKPELEHGSAEVFPYQNYYVLYRCERGYERRGNSVQYCDLATGKWKGSPPTCEKLIDCGHPGNIINGAVTAYDGTHEGTYARYRCNDGYSLRGATHRRCGSDGRWGRTEPTCEVDCGHPGYLLRGRVSIWGGTKPGSYARYSCSYGYTLKGTSFRTCGEDGTWNGTRPTCEEINCGHPGNIDNGRVTTGIFGRTRLGSTARYACNVGYVLNGTSSRRCGSDGGWGGTAPTCEEKDCGHPGEIMNGAVNVSEGTTLHATIQYTCIRRYRLNGPSSRTCGLDGQWTGITPTCEKVDCGHPGEVPYGQLQLPNGTKAGAKAHYSCIEGLRLKGPSKRKCRGNGKWSGRAPICTNGNKCPTLDNIPNGSVDMTGVTVGSTAIYTCNDNYQLMGASTRRCQPDGTWSGEEPMCMGRRT